MYRRTSKRIRNESRAVDFPALFGPTKTFFEVEEIVNVENDLKSEYWMDFTLTKTFSFAQPNVE
jgi:hypothetical protein